MIRTMLSKGIRLASLTSPKLPCLRYFSPFSSYSSRLNSSSSNPNSSASETNDIDDVPSDVSTQELKRRISHYLEGEDNAIPSIFEAILARKLSGKHDNSDDEIMEEFRSKKPENKNQYFPSNLDASDDNTDSDEDDADSDEGDADSDEHDTNIDEKDNDSGNELTLWLKEIQREQGREE